MSNKEDREYSNEKKRLPEDTTEISPLDVNSNSGSSTSKRIKNGDISFV